jgi:regulator of sirC expression with transglutaminase-like and TPR domain
MSAAARELLRDLLRRTREDVPLGEAALLVAKGERPELDVAAGIAKLDALGASARRAIAGEPAPERRVRLFGSFLFRDVGLRGNRADYYDPENSYLDSVLERRTGIPITLSILYLEVARRAGVPAAPVAFPGHFLARHDGLPAGPIFVDSFDAGRLLAPADCARLFAQQFGPDAPFAEDFLGPAPPRAVLARLLRNLKAIYVRRGDDARAFRAADWILLLAPGEIEERRDRGILAARLGRLDRAIADLVRYTRGAPESIERRELRAKIDDLRRRRAARN